MQRDEGEDPGLQGVVEHRHLDDQAPDPLGRDHRDLERDVGAQRRAADDRLLGAEVVEQRDDLLAEGGHRVDQRVGGPVGAAVAEQVEGHDVQAPGRHRPGQRLLHPARHQQPVQQHHPLVAGAVLGVLEAVAAAVGLDEELTDPLAHQHGPNVALLRPRVRTSRSDRRPTPPARRGPARVASQASAPGPRAYAAVASTSAQVRSGPITVTWATPGRGAARCGRRRCARRGGRCRTWRPRPCRTGTRASTRRGSCGSSMPDHATGRGRGRRRGRPCRRRPTGTRRCRRGRAGCAAARSTAQPFTTPLGSSTGRPSGPGRRTSKAPPDCTRASSPTASTSATSGGHSARVISPRSSRLTWESAR